MFARLFALRHFFSWERYFLFIDIKLKKILFQIAISFCATNMFVCFIFELLLTEKIKSH